jgi:putative RNA 2'-phosphotransferase
MCANTGREVFYFSVYYTMDYKQLSKTVALALRHEPEAFGLKLNTEGWVSLERLLVGLRRRNAFAEVSRDDIEAMMLSSDKQRFELVDDKGGVRIRAHYGHSIGTKIEKPTQQRWRPFNWMACCR